MHMSENNQSWFFPSFYGENDPKEKYLASPQAWSKYEELKENEGNSGKAVFLYPTEKDGRPGHIVEVKKFPENGSSW